MSAVHILYLTGMLVFELMERYAMPLYLQAISLLVPPDKDVSIEDRCEGAYPCLPCLSAPRYDPTSVGSCTTDEQSLGTNHATAAFTRDQTPGGSMGTSSLWID